MKIHKQTTSSKTQFCKACQQHWAEKHLCYGRVVDLHSLEQRMFKLEKLLEKLLDKKEAGTINE